MKKIVIFGSTGKTGLCATEAAVKKGLKVRAFLRDPNKLPTNLRDKVDIMKGDVLEPDSVQRALEGMDGVVICLGTGDSLAPTSDMSEGTKNIIDAMRQKNVNVVSACLSAFLIYEPSKVPERFVPLNEDHKRMYNALKDSSLNYIVVFPPHIADEPSREVITKMNPTEVSLRTISKYDLGKFLVDVLDDPQYYRQGVGIGNVPNA
ncbi:flavin reductase (NADPH) [Hyposmocoma kahamanoa]|uniref:flavin reductase (NADPH) n=1 Tax=Hyposmocoma kahamanoa TaxID=1477025 RepID=UPI000E6D93CB|nr:flavin reductase (NADPH) [Hyposmocoma kahamanoa]